MNAFVFFWGGIILMWIICPFRLLGRVWRKLQNDEAIATVVVPLCHSSIHVVGVVYSRWSALR